MHARKNEAMSRDVGSLMQDRGKLLAYIEGGIGLVVYGKEIRGYKPTEMDLKTGTARYSTYEDTMFTTIARCPDTEQHFMVTDMTQLKKELRSVTKDATRYYQYGDFGFEADDVKRLVSKFVEKPSRIYAVSFPTDILHMFHAVTKTLHALLFESSTNLGVLIGFESYIFAEQEDIEAQREFAERLRKELNARLNPNSTISMPFTSRRHGISSVAVFILTMSPSKVPHVSCFTDSDMRDMSFPINSDALRELDRFVSDHANASEQEAREFINQTCARYAAEHIDVIITGDDRGHFNTHIDDEILSDGLSFDDVKECADRCLAAVERYSETADALYDAYERELVRLYASQTGITLERRHRPDCARRYRRNEAMNDRQLKTFAKNNSTIYSGKFGDYTFISQGNYMYCTKHDIARELEILKPYIRDDFFKTFSFILDERNWDEVVDRYDSLCLPVTDDGNLICQTEEGVGIFDKRMLAELSRFFVSSDRQVFQCITGLSDEYPTMFIGLASRDRSEIGVLIHCGDSVATHRELAVKLHDAVLSDLEEMLDLEGVHSKDCKGVFSTDVSIAGKCRIATLRLRTFKTLPVDMLVTWAIKNSVFWTSHGQWDGEMALHCCRRLEKAAKDGFNDFKDFESVMSVPFDSYDEQVFELDLSEYRHSLELIDDSIFTAVYEAKEYMKKCRDELARQIETDPDYFELMHHDGILKNRFRDIGCCMDDFEKFCRNADAWFPADVDEDD